MRAYEEFFVSRQEENEDEIEEEEKFDFREGLPKFKRIMESTEFFATQPNEIIFKRN